MPTPNPDDSVIALDWGQKRIGVAKARLITRLPEPIGAVEQAENLLQSLAQLVRAHNATHLVIGLPRGLKGQETPQTGVIRKNIALLKEKLDIPIYEQDEAVTSLQAEAELKERKVQYNKEDVDALSAVYILEDFLREHPDL
jgi:putative Holliday junction resolvase